jgi:hypothetical protein
MISSSIKLENMQFEQVLQKSIEEGAIRFYRVSESMAFVYRYSEPNFEARGLYAKEGSWSLGSRLVSTINYSRLNAWHIVPHLPWQAEAIDDEQARQNPGYGIALLVQCYTCKESKGFDHFSRMGKAAKNDREWECDDCFQRRSNELALFKAQGSSRSGDDLHKETISSPAPPSSEI